MLTHEELFKWEQELKEREKQLKIKEMELQYKDKGLDILEYKLQGFYSGWSKRLKGNLYKTYDGLLMIAADLLKRVNTEIIEEQGYFYIKFPYRLLHDDLGVSSGAISGCIKELCELGLIRVDPEDRGEEGMGASTIYFPIQVPEPEEVRILGYIERKYKNDINEFTEKQKRNEEKTKVVKKLEKENYIINNFDKYDVSKISAVNDKRNALIEQAYALWVNKGYEMTEQLKKEITKVIKYHVRKTKFDFVLIQNVIRYLFEKEIAPTDLVSAIKKEIECYTIAVNTYEKQNHTLTKVLGKSFKERIQEEVRTTENPIEFLKEEIKKVRSNPLEYSQEQIDWLTQYYINYKTGIGSR